MSHPPVTRDPGERTEQRTGPFPESTDRPLAAPEASQAPTDVPDSRAGLRRTAPGRLSRAGWLAILAVTTVGGLLRFWRLDHPRQLVFDETYYVKQAATFLTHGYELQWKGEGKVVDPTFAAGNPDVFKSTPDFVVHPPVGKWMIAVGEWIFGPTSSWGWRFSAAVVGTLSILMIALIARRLFASTLLGVVAAVLLTVDGQHFVHSRTGLLDVFLMFWALAAFGCLLIDRDVGRRRLAAALDRHAAAAEAGPGPASSPGRRLGPGLGRRLGPGLGSGLGPGLGSGLGSGLGRRLGLGPGLGLRWWRVAAGICLGLAIGTKWSGLYFAVVFGVMTVLWDIGARRAAGVRHWLAGGLLRDGLSGALLLGPVALTTYLASWTGWFLSEDAYDRAWAGDHPSAHHGWVPGALRGLWHYHQQMYEFHVSLSSPHAWASNPWSWLVVGRPTLFFYQSPTRGQRGCTVAQCSEAITALGNPVIWWGAVLGIAVLLFRWTLRRDWRAGAVLAGLLAGYVPWLHYQQRTIFNFYAIAFTPFIVLSLTYLLGLMLGPTGAPPRRRRIGGYAAGGVVLLAVLVFWFFLPVYTAEVTPVSWWRDRVWLPSWN